MSKLIKKLIDEVPPHVNGGESLVIQTEIFDNGDYAHGLDEGIFINQTITLQSYCNNASFSLVGNALYPKYLRQLADKIEKGIEDAKLQIRNKE